MNRIKELRLLHKKSQAEVAEAVGLAQQSYQRYETPNASPSGELLVKLANYYGVSVDYILENEAKENADMTITDRDFIVLHRAYNNMGNKEKDKLKKVLALTFDIAFNGEDTE